MAFGIVKWDETAAALDKTRVGWVEAPLMRDGFHRAITGRVQAQSAAISRSLRLQENLPVWLHRLRVPAGQQRTWPRFFAKFGEQPDAVKKGSTGFLAIDWDSRRMGLQLNRRSDEWA